MTALDGGAHRWVSLSDPSEDRLWLFDVTFLRSRWTCIYGRGCSGIAEERAPERARGCCTHGAHFTGPADRARVEALVARLTSEQWQLAAVGRRRGVVAVDRDGSARTRLHQGACILLNRPGFSGGPGCALHRAALERGERPLDWKPDVCWQLPLRRVDLTDELGRVVSTVRAWERRDWGDGGLDFAWWCTSEPEAFVGAQPVWRAMADELAALVGQPVYDRLAALLEQGEEETPLPRPAARRRRWVAGTSVAQG